METTTKRPHAVCIPYPAQSHITAMFKLAKLLHHKGFYITFIHTEHNYQRLLKSRGADSLKGLPDFQFQTIPDGLPPAENPDASQDMTDLCVSTSKNCLVPFRNLLAKLNDSPDVPPVSCIVSDAIMSFTLEAAEELDIPEVLYCPVSACFYLYFLHYPHFVERGVTSFKRDASYLTNGALDTVIDWIPGINEIRLRDIPTQNQTTDPSDPFLEFSKGEIARAFKASAVLFNTFDDLEQDALDSLSSMLNRIYTVGPLQLLLNHQIIPSDDTDRIGSNLWKEDSGCLAWLDSKQPGSVVYVNFGSIAVMTPQQLHEFAWGLANSMQTFLWIIRPDLVIGETAILPPEFVTTSKDRGMLASWCAQEQVLNHPSIGGFLTHSGWISTIESLSSGVPMLCWPFGGDQHTNCFYSCTNWGIGMEIDNDVKREKVEKLVRELMEGEKGKEMKKRAIEWKKKAEEVTSPYGSSYLNFDKMIEEMLLST